MKYSRLKKIYGFGEFTLEVENVTGRLQVENASSQMN
jgi:hypothetical protein